MTADEQLRRTLLSPLLDGLARQVRRSQGLCDPEADAFTPADHYGNTSASLAFAVAGGEYRGFARETLEAWLTESQGSLGHHPFNRLMLRLHERAALEVGVGAPLTSLRRGLTRCPLRRRYPSNNWGLLAQCCRVIEVAGTRGQARELDRYTAMLDRWLTPDGGFIDFPYRPRNRRGATPIAYHHKALFLTALLAWIADAPELRTRLEGMLSWALLVWDGTGYAGGLGRSTHSLFGDACLLAAATLLQPSAHAEVGTALNRLRLGVTARLSRQFRPDGLLNLNPAGSTNGWDEYMHLSVYNAWTAAVLGWASWCVATGVPPPSMRCPLRLPGLPGIQSDAYAGLARLPAGSDGGLLLSTAGQPPQAYSRAFVELRYAGGVPLHLWDGGRPCVPPPVRVAVGALREQPALGGWTPLFEIDGELYALARYDRVVERGQNREPAVCLIGYPTRVQPDDEGRFAARLLAAADWRVLGGALRRRQALRQPASRAFRAEVRFRSSRERLRLEMEVTIDRGREAALADVTYLNPGGHGVLASRPPVARRFELLSVGDRSEWYVDGGEWKEAVMPSVLPDATGLCRASRPVSDGESRYWLALDWDGRD